jgi:hypothetical protein
LGPQWAGQGDGFSVTLFHEMLGLKERSQFVKGLFATRANG